MTTTHLLWVHLREQVAGTGDDGGAKAVNHDVADVLHIVSPRGRGLAGLGWCGVRGSTVRKQRGCLGGGINIKKQGGCCPCQSEYQNLETP
jgi:hypothetical protein